MTTFGKWIVSWILLLLFSRTSVVVSQELEQQQQQQQGQQTCTWDERETCIAGPDGLKVFKEKNLKPIKVALHDDYFNNDNNNNNNNNNSNNDVDGPDTFYAYVQPHIAYAYNTTPGNIHARETDFRGMFGKFINLSNKPVKVFWKPSNPSQQSVYIADIAPFGAAGTATYPRHHFVVVPAHYRQLPTSPEHILAEFHVKWGHSLYSYDPYGSVEEASKVLTKPEELEMYQLQHRSLAFSKVYQHVTGREYLALYGRKYAPRYPIWPADQFGQYHAVETKETHFTSLPPDDIAKKPTPMYGTTPEQRERLKEFRSPEESLTLNMTVISVAPRAFEIQNFLSPEEVHHMMELALGMTLSRSTTKAGPAGKVNSADNTRTSLNSWIGRSRSPIVDAIFRRAADLLQIDEACFRPRTQEEAYLVPDSVEPISERLQLVHYAVGQQYTPHHDFAVPDLKDGQPSRFATVLLYLNTVEKGGETSFPRWLNGETTEILKVKPEPGKAILFYNQLPDGNYDERSEHAALPVIEGEKWLANLWVWDPYMY